MRRLGVVCVVAIGLAGCGGSQSGSTTSVTVTQTVGTIAPPAPPRPFPTTTTQSPPQQLYEPYSATAYSLERPAGWITEADQTANSSVVESKWRDPSDPKTSVLIDTIPSPASTAQADAASVRTQTSSTPGYQEISFDPASINGNDGWKWTFEVSGTKRVDYFLNVCGTSFAILGTTTPQRFDELAPVFQHVAESVQPTCNGTSTPPTPPTTTTAPSTVDFCSTHSCIPNFPNGTGYIVQCQDLEWSHSGGRPGACSGHGGETSITYP